MVEKFKVFIEQRAFGVCTWLGNLIGVSSGSIRLYFIYISFLTVGSPLVIYLVLAFWLNLRSYNRKRLSPFWDV